LILLPTRLDNLNTSISLFSALFARFALYCLIHSDLPVCFFVFLAIVECESYWRTTGLNWKLFMRNREKKFDNKFLIVENKMKSIPQKLPVLNVQSIECLDQCGLF
jgi:hypothetical protein